MGEIVLENLIDMLMRTAIEHTNAERAVLMLAHGAEHRIQAEATTGDNAVMVRLRGAWAVPVEVPESIVQHTARTAEPMILDDGSVENPFSDDAYFRRHRTRSLLCLPLLYRAKHIGVLYLENSLAAHVFTTHRLSILKLLASQVAISLENSRLCNDLEEREARIRCLVDANIIGIVFWHLDGRVIDANDAFLRMLQYDRGDLNAGLRWTDMTPPDWRGADAAVIEEIKATGTMRPYEKEYFRKDGTRVPVLIGGVAFDGCADQGVDFIVDLTERKQAEERAREGQHRFLDLVNAIEGIVWEADAMTFEASFVSKQAERVLGYPVERWVSEPTFWRDHLHPDDRERTIEFCVKAIAQKRGLDFEYRMIAADGRIVWLRDLLTLVVESNRATRLRGVMVDITERKRADEELDRLRQQLESHNAYLREEVDSALNFGRIVGRSRALRHVLQQVDEVASTGATVLITGESGTGKELLAKEIHERGPRSQRPFVRVNCSAIPREMFESEFFGHVRGAFTGAVRDRPGRFQIADGGTIFLDEIGDLPADLQPKLLRVLQEGEYERVGEDVTRRIDVRVIAATNQNLVEEVRARRFRQDLFYRLNVFPLELPPLRARTGDIPLLAAHAITEVSKRLKMQAPPLTQADAARLQQYDWLGNVRELQNVIERAVILSKGVRLRLDIALADASKTAPTTSASDADMPAVILTDHECRQRERANLMSAIKRADGRVYGEGGAAELLGIKPTTLASRLRALKITIPKPR